MLEKHDLLCDLFDDYVHKNEPRREFLRKVVKATGGVAAAAAVLPLLEGTGAEAAMTRSDDPRLDAKMMSYPGGAGMMSAYVVRPKGTARLPAVVVIHENRGLTPHIQDVARRIALEGFIAVAPDMLTPEGGTPKDQDKGRDMIRKLKRGDIVKNLVATSRFAAKVEGSDGNVGAVGFCWGGQRTNELAVADPNLKAAVPYYGRQPKTGIEKINAALLLHYAENDKNVDRGIPAYERALKAAGKSFEVHIYPGTRHAFNNDTRPGRYNKAAAELAWKRTVAFLKKHVR